MRQKLIVIATAVCAFLAGGALYYFVMTGNDSSPVVNKGSASNGSTSQVVQCDSNWKLDDTGIATAVGQIYDATVTIQNYQNDKLTSSGSGFIYKKDDRYGYIMTNHHVVSGASKIVITLSDDTQIEGTVLGSDQYLDLASVRIDVKYVKQVATIGNSDSAKLGDTIFTVGTPVGYEYRGTVTRGTLSGKNRMVSVSVSNNDDWIMKVLQIDAAINPGNSGGPLLNVNGEVIGINSLKLVQQEIEGMGFAIPIEDAMNYIEVLEKGEKINRPMLGVSMLNVTDAFQLYQSGIRIADDIATGVVVVEVSDKGAAEKAGLQKGDVIVQLGDAKVTNSAYLKYELYKYNPGDTVEITYIRDNRTKTVKVTLGKAG